MHELGIVFHIIRGVEEVGRKNRVKRVCAVTLQLGEVSGVVEHYLQDCWRCPCFRQSCCPPLEAFLQTGQTAAISWLGWMLFPGCLY